MSIVDITDTRESYGHSVIDQPVTPERAATRLAMALWENQEQWVERPPWLRTVLHKRNTLCEEFVAGDFTVVVSEEYDVYGRRWLKYVSGLESLRDNA